MSSYRVLVVASDSGETDVIERALIGAGWRVTVVRTFEEGKYQISLDCPDLLVAAVRLAAFSGLHLLLRCRVDHPTLPVIIVGDSEHRTPDISQFGARFQAYPIDGPSFVQLVADAMKEALQPGSDNRRQWLRKPADLPAVVQDATARVVELGYGGLRLEISGPRPEVRGPIDVRFTTLGLSVTAVPRWCKGSESLASWWCGAEIVAAGGDATRVWRRIVDLLN